MKIDIIVGPKGPTKDSIIKQLRKGLFNQVEDFCNGNLKTFLGGRDVQTVICNLTKPLKEQLTDFINICSIGKVNVRFPYEKNAEIMDMPNIIIYSEFTINQKRLSEVVTANFRENISIEIIEIDGVQPSIDIFDNEFQPIRDWAQQRGLYDKGDLKTQFIKLAEENGELAKAILEDNLSEIKDAIGDKIVVLTNFAHLCGLRVEDCINSAYNEIKDRKGSMKNGTFVKNNS